MTYLIHNVLCQSVFTYFDVHVLICQKLKKKQTKTRDMSSMSC
jgi:hypothetical protein